MKLTFNDLDRLTRLAARVGRRLRDEDAEQARGPERRSRAPGAEAPSPPVPARLPTGAPPGPGWGEGRRGAFTCKILQTYIQLLLKFRLKFRGEAESSPWRHTGTHKLTGGGRWGS